MNKQTLFIQGGGENGYEVDKALVASLQTELGKEYTVKYPEIKPDESAPDFGWLEQIGKYILGMGSGFILAGHSFGASMILKYLSEKPVNIKPAGIFLMATPFWNGNEDWQAGLQLQDNFADHLPKKVSLFFYHCEDDEEIPFSNLNTYKQNLSQAIFREIKQGGHQFNNDLALVANDIKSLYNNRN